MLCHSYVEFWLFESNNKEKSPECSIELTLIAKQCSKFKNYCGFLLHGEKNTILHSN